MLNVYPHYFQYSEPAILLNKLRYYRQERKAAKRGVVVKGLGGVTKRSHLLLEEHTKLRHVLVELPDSNTPLSIGAHSYIRSGTRLMYVSDIGRFCCIGRGITIGETPRNHPIDWVSASQSISTKYVAHHDYVVIGHDVWIGHDAVIMAGVKVGHGAVIGRNAVVTKDVEPYQIVAGNPAKPIRYRFEQARRDALLASKWWEKEVSALTPLPCDDVDRFLPLAALVPNSAKYAVVEIKRGKVL